MNQARQAASGQAEICEQTLSQETRFQLHKTLCKLQRLLIKHLGLTCQGQMRSQVARYALHRFALSFTVVMKLLVTKKRPNRFVFKKLQPVCLQ